MSPLQWTRHATDFVAKLFAGRGSAKTKSNLPVKQKKVISQNEKHMDKNTWTIGLCDYCNTHGPIKKLPVVGFICSDCKKTKEQIERNVANLERHREEEEEDSGIWDYLVCVLCNLWKMVKRHTDRTYRKIA